VRARHQIMQTSILTLAALLFVFLGPSASAAGDDLRRLSGVVADESGGVLPGVTVVAAAEDATIVATIVTDQVGHYAFRALPSAAVRLTFQLEGFSIAAIDVPPTAGIDSVIPTQRLTLAPKSENVVVRGTSPAVPPAPTVRIVIPPAPPPPVVSPVPEHDKDSVCGPAKPGETTPSFGTIRSRRLAAGHGLYASGDELLIDGGKTTGLEVGLNLVARRSFHTSGEPNLTGEHTAGVLQIVAADEQTAVAVVVYACDEVMQGDWLAPFEPEPIRAPERAGMPVYDQAARILLSDADQLIGAPRRLMVIDQGRDNGIRVGQRVTLFRERHRDRRGPAVIGDAVVVALRLDSATIRIQHATDVIAVGDSAAPQRP
jgi:hypothetical protein